MWALGWPGDQLLRGTGVDIKLAWGPALEVLVWASGWPGDQLLRYWCGPVEQGKRNGVFDCVKSAVLAGGGPR